MKIKNEMFKNEVIYGIDGKKAEFDANGIAEVDERLGMHFLAVPGFTEVVEEAKKEEVKEEKPVAKKKTAKAGE